MRAILLGALVSCALACEREPAIVIRFEAQDLAARDLARARDLAPAPVDAATPVEAQAAKACQKDADCVAVADDCCDCKSGGKQHAQHKAAAKPDHKRCADVMCAAMLSNDPSCAKKPACVAHACVLK